MQRSRFGAALAALLLPLAVAAEPTSLLAIHPTSPWTLRDLEALGAPLVSYDPDTGIAWVVANAAEEARLVAHGFAVATAQPDVESGLRALAGEPDLGAYHTFDEMRAEIDLLVTSYPDLARREVLGRSGEGRDIVALKISDDPATDDPTEPDFLIVGCHHAREFMSVELPLFVARTLLERAATDARVARIVAEREIWIVPMLNPDGHVYQEQYQASPEWDPPGWRKNRTPNFDGSIGVDPNRNYSFEWGHDDEGSSPDGLSETYRGTAPFSEPENRALRSLVERQRFVIAISYHSFGKLLLYPWGFERGFTEDHATFAALADSMVRQNGYRPGNPALGTIYLTNGELDDWLYGEITTRKPQRTFGFTVEMNLASEGGFWPPESMIAPTCAALLHLNLYALEAAANVHRPLPPLAPILLASQEPTDGRIIHLQWTQPPDEGNPVHHYEVFEIDPIGIADLAPQARLDTPGRAVLAAGLPVPRSGELVVQMQAELENLWDYAYVEVRDDDGRWRAQRGDATRTASPTGRNDGHGVTGGIPNRTLRFQLDAAARAAIGLDVAIRFDRHPRSPQHGSVRARLDVPATYGERRRIVDPDVRDTRYDVTAPRAGIFAYGVSAVDAEGQLADSEIFFFVIPTVDVALTDVALEVEGANLVLSPRSRASPPPCPRCPPRCAYRRNRVASRPRLSRDASRRPRSRAASPPRRSPVASRPRPSRGGSRRRRSPGSPRWSASRARRARSRIARSGRSRRSTVPCATCWRGRSRRSGSSARWAAGRGRAPVTATSRSRTSRLRSAASCGAPRPSGCRPTPTTAWRSRSSAR